jgi:L-ascorbate metabolism protein UlaG (beta-lactamase superfamily)
MTSSSASTSTVEWFGTTTFRVRQSGLDLFFDGYLDRLPGLDPVGLRVEEVERADFVFVSHAHFDHLYGVLLQARVRIGPAPVRLGTAARSGRMGPGGP